MDKTKAGEIILQNLSEAANALTRKSLIYDAQIKELAYLLVDEACEDQYDDFELIADRLRSAYSAYFFEDGEIRGDKSSQILHGIDFKIRFCALAAEELSLRGVKAPEFDDFDEIFDGEIKIACFSNRAADEAYEKFARHIPKAKQVICESIAAICEEVSDGRCELCLLPIYSSADGLMQNLYRQTVRFGLAPIMSINMPSDGDFFVRYFLFAANPCRRVGADTISLTVVPDGEAEIAFLPAALSAYGAELEDVHSLAHSLYEGNRAFQFAFNVKDADMMKIGLFLQINFPRFEINGMYEKIETELNGI